MICSSLFSLRLITTRSQFSASLLYLKPTEIYCLPINPYDSAWYQPSVFQMEVHENIFGDHIHMRSFQKRAHQKVLGQTGLSVIIDDVCTEAVTVCRKWNLPAVHKRCCQHYLTSSAEYQKTKNANDSIQVKQICTCGLKLKKKLAKKVRKGDLQWVFLRVRGKTMHLLMFPLCKYLDCTDVIPWQRKLAFFLFFFLINTLRAVFPCLQWKLKNAPKYSGNKFNAIPKGKHS